MEGQQLWYFLKRRRHHALLLLPVCIAVLGYGGLDLLYVGLWVVVCG